MIDVGESVKSQVNALESRRQALLARGRVLVPIGVGLGLAGGASNLLAHWLSPDVVLSHIDIPAKLLEHFGAQVSGAAGSEAFTSVANGLVNHLSSLQPLVGLIAVVYGLLGMFNSVRTGEPSRAIIPIVAGIGLVFSLSFMKMLVGDGDGAQITPREAFMQEVEQHRYESVATDLRAAGQAGSPAGSYVLAQLTLTGDRAVANGKVLVNADLVGRITSAGAQFSPKGDALYAIEHAAFGSAKSPAALAYESEHVQRQGWARLFYYVLTGLGSFVGGTAVMFMSLGSFIGRRVRRIHDLLELTAA